MTGAPDSKACVLIVDDVAVNIRLLGDALKQDYRVLVATSGERALELVNKSPRPDLVLLDVMMPSLDGYTVCARMKSDPATSDIPIIFITAKGEAEDEERGLNLGAVDYIAKPFNLAIVKARVRTHIALKQKTDLLNRLSSYDGLTDIANRRHFDTALDREWRRAARAGRPVSLLMIDVDFFKQYNDGYGHLAGDICLKRIAKTLSGVLKRPADMVARYGGEEFVVLLPDSDTRAAQAIAEMIHGAVAALGLEHKGSAIADHVTVSIGGVTLTPSASTSMQQLLDVADGNLYTAKGAGRDQICCGKGD